VAERARILAELGPGLLERIAAPAELREQLALQLREVVPGRRAVGVPLLHRETAIHPGERLVPLAPRLEHGGDREAVLDRELAPLAERDVGPHIALLGVDRAQGEQREPPDRCTAKLGGFSLLVCERPLHCSTGEQRAQ
jgi:hypothetical protein